MKHERRGFLPLGEVRMDADTARVEGYAAVFRQDANIAGMFVERIMPGAFANAIARDDIAFLVNHDGLPLARSRAGSGTLALSEDDRGLFVQTDLDMSDPDVSAVVPKMRRGDLDKMSFGFTMDGGRQEWDESGDLPIRTIHEFGSVFDVSVVTFPAYDGTEIALRSRQIAAAIGGGAARALRAKLRSKILAASR